jgi:Trypsin-like peptidase domain/TPR repeat
MKYSLVLTAALFGTSVALVQQVASAKSAEEVGSIATAITVEMKSNANIGSGILLQHQGDTYTVLTAYHVVKGNKSMTIKTVDGTVHKMLSNSMRQAGNNLDLAVVKFQASQSYTLAKIGTSNTLKVGSAVYVAGFPEATLAIESGLFNFTDGKVIGKANKGNSRGYSLIYSNITRGGMSGGPVLNELGELVAIHGQGDRESDETGAKTGRNLGIVIERFSTAAVSMGVPLDQQVAALPPSQPANAADYYVIASEKSDNGNFQGAIADYNRAIALDATYSLAYLHRGVARMQLKNKDGGYDSDGALNDFNRSIALDPKLAEAYAFRGVIMSLKLYPVSERSQNNISIVLADFSKAISLDPKLAMAYSFRCFMKASILTDVKGGLADCDRAIAIDPESGVAYGFRSAYVTDRASKIRDLRKAAQLFRKQKKIQRLREATEELRKLGASE